MANEFKVKNGLIVVGDTAISGAATVGGNSVIHTGNIGTYAITSLSDTLDSITSRGNSTSNAIIVGGTLWVGNNIRNNNNGNQRINFNSANLSFMVNGSSEAVSIFNSTSNVGISTTTDSGYKLDVNGEARTLSTHRIWKDNQVGEIKLELYGGQSGWESSIYHNVGAGGSGQRLTFRVGGSTTAQDRMTIDTSGNVGIGTTSPSENLHIDGNVKIGGGSTLATKLYIVGTGDRGMYIQAKADGNGSKGAVFNLYGSTTSGAFYFAGDIAPQSYFAYNLGNSSVPWLGVYAQRFQGRNNASEGTTYVSSGTSSNPLILQMGGTEYFRLAATTGNVLIGTTTDAGYKLDVNGTARIGNSSYYLTLGNGGADGGVFRVGGASYGYAELKSFGLILNGGHSIAGSGGTAGFIITSNVAPLAADDDDYDGAMVFRAGNAGTDSGNTWSGYSNAKAFNFIKKNLDGTYTSLMVLHGNTNNVGIGTTTPTTALDVNGIITATGGNSTSWNTAYSWGDHSAAGYLTSASLSGYATQSYVTTQIANLVDSAPATLDTLNELAAALGDDPNFATTVSTSIGTKWTQDNTKISNWDTAYSWGNHASVGYLTSYTETDPVFTASAAAGITATNISNWNTAYSWGNHAGLYALASHTHTFASLTSKPTTLAGYGITDAASSTHTHDALYWRKSTMETQNPVGVTYGQGVSSAPPYYIGQVTGDNDGWRIYGEAPSTNDVKVIFEVVDDLEAGDTWVFRNKQTYSPYLATEAFIIEGNGNIRANGTVTANGGNSTQWNTAYSWGNHAGLYDNYGSWNLKTNGSQRTTVGSGGNLDIVAGTNVSVSYSAGGVVTINSTDTNTTYSAGTGLTLSGTTFSVTSGTYAAASHTHSATDITSGTLASARLSGTYAISVSGSAATLTTARTLTIGGTGKTFNGSANVSWTLAEIGALGATAKAADSELLDGLDSSSFLRSNAADSFSGILTGTATGENLKIGGIRGTAKGSQTGEYIHLYERVHIGGPSGWGAASHGAPSYGLSTWGSVDFGMNGTGVIQLDGTTIVNASRQLINVTNTNWDTAYGWGNHASAGYLTSSSLSGYATQTYVNTAVANLIDSAPGTLDTLNELAAALGDDPNFATTVTNSIATKLPLAGGTMTGDLTLSYAYPRINLYDTNHNSDYSIINNDGSFSIYDITNNSHRLQINSSGNLTLVGTITASGYNNSNWDTAYGWGNHAVQGYATTTQLADYLPLTGGTIAGALTISGNLVVNGTITENSSIKIKENVEDLNGSLEKVVNLRPVSYNKIGQTEKELGLIAEEVQTVYPEFVQFDENGEPVGVNYSRLTVALIGAVQELTKQVEELKNKING